MDDLERWTQGLNRSAAEVWSAAAATRFEARLAMEADPAATAGRRERRRVTTCLVTAAALGFLTTGVLEARVGSTAAARWPASVSASSPSVLLLAERGR